MKTIKFIGSFIPLLVALYIFYLAFEPPGEHGESITVQQKHGLITGGIFMVGVFVYAVIDVFKKKSKN